MRSIMYILTALAVIGAGFWAYNENYRTQAELDRVDHLRRDISLARERLAILRAEWAYLNRPDRLRDLADLNFPRLELMPLRPDQFGRLDQVAYPVPQETGAALNISNAIDISSAGAQNP